MVVLVGERDGASGAADHRDRRREQPVVRTEEDAGLRLDRDRPPVGADSGVDDREHDPFGQVLHRAHERECAGPDVVRRDVVGDVDDRELGREAEHHCLADADELVGVPVVGQERHNVRRVIGHRWRLRRAPADPNRAPRGTESGHTSVRSDKGFAKSAHPTRSSDGTPFGTAWLVSVGRKRSGRAN